MTRPPRSTAEVLGWALAEARRHLPHEWVHRESDDLFRSWSSEEHQRLLSVEVFRDGRGGLVHFTPGVVFASVEAARVALRRTHELGGLVEDAVPYTLHADLCPELGRLTVFVEDGSPLPDAGAVLARVRAWCAEFEPVARVQTAIEHEEILRSWCGREREPRDWETLAAIHAAAGNEVLSRKIVASVRVWHHG